MKASYNLLLPDSHFTQVVAVIPSSEGGYHPSPSLLDLPTSLFQPVKNVFCVVICLRARTHTRTHTHTEVTEQESMDVTNH